MTRCVTDRRTDRQTDVHVACRLLDSARLQLYSEWSSMFVMSRKPLAVILASGTIDVFLALILEQLRKALGEKIPVLPVAVRP